TGAAGGAGGAPAAQGVTTPGMEITPDNLTTELITGQSTTYTLLIRATGTISNLQVIPNDLRRRDNRGPALGADRVQVQLPNEPLSLTPGTVITVPVRISLNGASAGEYLGNLLLNYEGGSTNVPVVVRVKDDFWLAAILLLIGVAFGIGVATYREQGRPRD